MLKFEQTRTGTKEIGNVPEKPYRILVVEDEEMILRGIEAFLQDEGFEVRIATSGEESLDILNQEKMDLLIVDMRLPNIDGDMVILEALRLDPSLKFIIHTGSSQYQLPPELRERGLKDTQVLIKPIHDMNLLTNLINDLLKN